MSEFAIQSKDLGKRYQIGERAQYTALRDVLTDALYAPFRRLFGNSQFAIRNSQSDHIWALKDVSFDIKHGEVVGIIGHNGAGKTTLLKILSRIADPTEGCVDIYGRLGSLLEVGTGFHGELTGRENIYLNGAILGMRKAEVDRKFDEIVAFSEIERFIDTPVKHYSAGMWVRLAFAVAAHLDPEILLLDEVLAMGDAGFQKKCLKKMGEVGQGGRTVLLVSHNMAAVTNLCERAILLKAGRIVRDGPAPVVVREYLESFGDGGGISLEDRMDRYGSGRLRITNISLEDATGRPVRCFRSGEAGRLVIQYRGTGEQSFRNVLVSLALFSPWGEKVCELETTYTGDHFDVIAPRGRFICQIPRLPLQAGNYQLTIRVCEGERIYLDLVQNAGQIRVEKGDFFGTGRLPDTGTILVDHSWRYEPDDQLTADYERTRTATGTGTQERAISNFEFRNSK
jgi:lipopolysaccharide transport system ATP-binding protein